jgi:uncharacterized circularly permuted ATP-grasp superfamily protein
VALRPRLLSRGRWQHAVEAAEAVRAALMALEQALLRDPELRAELDLAPGEEELALADPGTRFSSPSSRLDSFYADEVGYVEFNAESPAGMAYGDELADVFETLPVMQQLRSRWELQSLPARHNQLEAMLRAFKECGHGESPSVAIVDWSGLPTLHEFELFRTALLRTGIPCTIADPTELSFQQGALRTGDGTAVNLVYRRVLTSELLAREADTRALRDAYLAGAVCVVNSFRAKLLHKKMSLALLSDDLYASLFNPAERAAIAQYVPWTRKVCECATMRGTRAVPDLVAHILAHRRELVLKPNDEYGGKGVILGWTVDDAEWEQAVAVALTQSYVVQEAIPVPRECYPVALGDSVRMLDMAVDMDPYLFGDEVGGVLTRLSSSALLNVTAGAGSVVPSYVIEKRR